MTVRDLVDVLNPSLLSSAYKARVPWSRDETINFDAVTGYYFRGQPVNGHTSGSLQHQFRPALKTLSTLGLDQVPDLLQLLPDPESKDFPEQALGLILLLDQAPRSLFEGRDERYTTEYFGVLALKLSKQLLALPERLRPISECRWVEELGYSFEYWIILRFWLIAPFAHSEDIADQRTQLGLIEESRLAVEKHTGKIDPHREHQEQDLKDVTAFCRRAFGAPKPPDTKVEDFMFWFGNLFDVHLPIVEKFGRYPYRNGAVGRLSTAQELEFLDETDHFGETDATAAAQIREDVLAGIWSPLSDGET